MEATLSKSGRTDLSFVKNQKSSIPEEWKEWMKVKLINTNVKWPMDSFGHVLTSYLKSLLWKSVALSWWEYGATQKRQAFCTFYFVSIGRQNNRCQRQLESQFEADQTNIQHYSSRIQLVRWIYPLFWLQKMVKVGKEPNGVGLWAEELAPLTTNLHILNRTTFLMHPSMPTPSHPLREIGTPQYCIQAVEFYCKCYITLWPQSICSCWS